MFQVEDVMDTCLKGTTMAERAQSLLDTGLGSDCEFIVGSQDSKVAFKACRTLLARASPVFERMFYGGLQTTNPIQVPDIEPEVFQLMLHSVDEVIKIYAHSVLASPEFENLSKTSLTDIVQLQHMNITSENELFQAVVRWTVTQCKEKGLCVNPSNLQEEVKEVICHIRFLSMSAAEFAEGPGESHLLSTEDKLAILKAIVTHGNIPPPDNMCATWEPRKEYTDYI
ncbi:hypothetical protein L9F63_009763 [Diploptera punctata]|uniref:BTB domain-containing protein n=1 Tax=Diploptera punctata TaxID=6984 RepID=A0AAD8EQY7_DIPPU|nr:hypothetical protein L9F63_009763 [Diploptera punctata]